MDLAEKVKKDLTEILAKYAAGNAEIVQTYFNRRAIQRAGHIMAEMPNSS